MLNRADSCTGMVCLVLAKEYSPNYVRIIQGMLSLAFDRAIILGLASKIRHVWSVHISQKSEDRFLDAG